MATKKIVSLKNEDIPQQIDTLRADLAKLTDMIKVQAADKVSEKTSLVKDVAAEKKDMAKERYDEITSKAETSIRENPLSAIAIAIGAGIVLGALTRR
ncbi:hypothetical protein [Fretibacter rubidus]|uniref:glycine zipper domain-containing protein n=1 Tax=Fretibacter rubidus TaxID=570162 RepID=UPI00352AFA85